MTTAHHTPYAFGGPLTSAAMEAPLGQLDAAIATVISTGSGTSTTLTAQALAAQASLTVASSAGFAIGDPIYIGTGATFESRIIATVPDGTTITVTVNLSNTYAVGTPISKSPVEIVDARGGKLSLGARISLIEDRVIDVMASPYNATGDGATDDRAAIQAAIDAATASAGGTVYFPPNTYKVGASLSLSANVRLQGAGDGSILDFTGTDAGNTGLVQVTGDHAMVTDLKLSDSRAYAANPINSVGVRVAAFGFVRIERCWIIGFKGGGITSTNTNLLAIRGCTIEAIGDQLSLVGDGILVLPTTVGANRISIVNNIVRLVGKHGINLTGNVTGRIKNANLVGNVLYSNGDSGVSCQYVVGGQVTGNDCIFNGQAKTAGAATGGQGIQFSNTTDVVASGNTCNDNTEFGIELRDSTSRVAVAGNVCKGNTFSGIRLRDATCVQVAVTGSVCASNGDHGIEIVNGPSRLTIVGNSCELNQDSGISLAGTPAGSEVTISGNQVRNNNQASSSSSGISIGGAYTDVAVTGNVVKSTAAPLQLWGIRFFSGDRVLIVGNQARGNTNQIATAPETGGSTNYLSANNLAT